MKLTTLTRKQKNMKQPKKHWSPSLELTNQKYI